MRKNLLFCILLGFLFLSFVPVQAATTPSSDHTTPTPLYLEKIASLKIKDVQKLIGRKLTLKEKVGFIVLKRQIKRNPEKVNELLAKNFSKIKKADGESSKGQAAFIFGIIGLGLFVLAFFVPYIIIPSLISAILAIVLGYMAKKENPDDKKAGAGKLMGWITLGVFALLLIVVAIALSGSDWW